MFPVPVILNSLGEILLSVSTKYEIKLTLCEVDQNISYSKTINSIVLFKFFQLLDLPLGVSVPPVLPLVSLPAHGATGDAGSKVGADHVGLKTHVDGHGCCLQADWALEIGFLLLD